MEIGAEEKKSQKEPENVDKSLMAPLSFLFNPYREEMEFCEWIKFAQKFAFVLIRDVGFLSSDTRQLLAVVLILIMLVLEMFLTPFSKRRVNLMSNW
jgi:hypothetical protein